MANKIMTYAQHRLLSNELLVKLSPNGLRLETPPPPHRLSEPFDLTLGQLMQANFNVYVDNLDTEMLMTNNAGIKACRVDSGHELIGKTPFNVLTKESASQIINTRNKIIQSKQAAFMDEVVFLSDNEDPMHFISAIYPFFVKGTLLGTLTCSVETSTRAVSQPFMEMLNFGLLDTFQQPQALNKPNTLLTPREKDSLQLLLKGLTAKEIAEILKLSSRTVEFYLSSIKKKFGVTKKSELIIKIKDGAVYN